jgi:ferric-dicitrate binding protein FerR (iron transport regulator)
MKIGFVYGAFLAMAFSVAGVAAAGAQSGAAGEQSNPLDRDSSAPTAQVAAADVSTARVTAASTATADVAAASVPIDNGARPGDSHVRIVRLSDVKGTLSLDRKTGNGFEQTMPNMPIIQGEKLRTTEGYAEVEFEDNSTLRVAPHSLVEFPLLALRSSGAKASTIEVVRGMVYVNLQGTKGNEFVLRAGDQTMTVSPSTHMRMTVEAGKTVVSVFNGSVEVKHGSEATLLTKKESLTLGGEQVAVTKKIEEEPYDAWDKEANDYHARYSQANAMVAGGATYGLSDLNYYGSFINGGAFGSFWQPYLAGAGWSPYGNGMWALYPGAGYSWVSPYPWGWLPYHSGNWSFYPGYGWGWQPGGTFNGLNNVASGGGAAGGLVGTTVHSPVRAASLVAPKAGAGSLVLANTTPMVFSKEDRAGNFVFQKNSAGLGVPRGSLGSLNKISTHVEQHGSASMQVYAAAPSAGFMASSHSRSSGPVTLRAGAPIQSANTANAMESYGRSSAPSAASRSVAAPSVGGGSSGGSGGHGGSASK